MLTTGNIANCFSEEFFLASAEYQSHIATVRDIHSAIYSSIIHNHYLLLFKNGFVKGKQLGKLILSQLSFFGHLNKLILWVTYFKVFISRL